jgi:hypothetical protein
VGVGAVGEDNEYFRRIKASNKRVVYCGKAIVWHPIDLNRTRLRFTAKWNLSLGRSLVRNESREQRKSIVFFAGIPRYLIKGLVLDVASLILSCLNPLMFFNAWRRFFCKLGMVEEYVLGKKERKSHA